MSAIFPPHSVFYPVVISGWTVLSVKLFLLLQLIVKIIIIHRFFYRVQSPWVWICNEQKQCIKSPAASTAKEIGLSHVACKLTCYDSAVLWPKPTTDPILSKELVQFKANRINITRIASPTVEVQMRADQVKNF